ncbi:hypothetical protein BKA93DRAFT_747335 [Sparassis latifolia]
MIIMRNRHPLIKLTLSCDGNSIDAIIDTSSMLNIVQCDIWKNLSQRPLAKGSGIMMMNANSENGQLDGLIQNVLLMCSGAMTWANMYIADQVPFQLLLGRPWQHDNHISIDECEDGTYLIFKNPFTCNPEQEMLTILDGSADWTFDLAHFAQANNIEFEEHCFGGLSQTQMYPSNFGYWEDNHFEDWYILLASLVVSVTTYSDDNDNDDQMSEDDDNENMETADDYLDTPADPIHISSTALNSPHMDDFKQGTGFPENRTHEEEHSRGRHEVEMRFALKGNALTEHDFQVLASILKHVLEGPELHKNVTMQSHDKYDPTRMNALSEILPIPVPTSLASSNATGTRTQDMQYILNIERHVQACDEDNPGAMSVSLKSSPMNFFTPLTVPSDDANGIFS